MEIQTDGELHQNQKEKNFNSKLWIYIISAVLGVAVVAVICLGVALLGANDKLEELSAKNQAAEADIVALQGDLALTDEELGKLATKYTALDDELKLSKAEQESLEVELDTLKKANQTANEEIAQLKNDAEKANEEIDYLKAQLIDPEDKIRIYIDQGHNPAPYHNIGAEGNGLYEQDVTFLIGCALADLLKADNRFAVKLSRPNKSVVLGSDNKSSLMARVEGAEKFNADYFISLHTNSFTQDTANGIEVYVAEDSSEAYVFGETLLGGLVDSTNLKNRGMKLNPDLDILEYSTMPAALIEMGFISNSTDAALLSEHPELFAQGIYNGLLDYFGLLPTT